MSNVKKLDTTANNTKGRVNRILMILDAMTEEERTAFFSEVSETYCVDCGAELPDEDSDEPDHDCPNAEDEDGGDEGVPGGDPGDEGDEGDVEDVEDES